jgi:hypothetical protein
MNLRTRILAALLALITIAVPPTAAAGVQPCDDMAPAAAEAGPAHDHRSAADAPTGEPGSTSVPSCPMSAVASCTAVPLPVLPHEVPLALAETAISAVDTDTTDELRLALSLFRPPRS